MQQPPLLKRKLLAEEEYEEVLETIINRDFFPDVKRWKHEVPSTTDDPSPPSAELPPASSLGLDEFQALHITEDDQSFERIQQEEAAQRRKRLAWMQEDSAKHNKALQDIRDSLDKLEDANEGGWLINGQRMRAIARESQRGVLMNRHVPHNALLFQPGEALDNFGRSRTKAMAILDDTGKIISPLAIAGSEYLPLAERKIEHESTRFSLEEQLKFQEMQLAPVQELVGERELEKSALEQQRRAGEEAIQRASFHSNLLHGIERTPVISAERDAPPEFTWGRVGMTPVVLNSEDGEQQEKDNSNLLSAEQRRFQIPSESIREATAEALRKSVLDKVRDKRRAILSLKDDLKAFTSGSGIGAGTSQNRSQNLTALTPHSIFAGTATATSSRHTNVLATPLAKSLTRLSLNGKKDK